MSQLDPTSGGDSNYDHHDLGESRGRHGSGEVSDASHALSRLENRVPSVPSALNWSYGPPPRPEILSAKPNPVELLHAVRRRWPLALGLGLLVSSLATGLVWYFLPVRYEAFALLKVAGRPPAIFKEGNTAVDEFAVFKRTQVQLILSNIVLIATLREPVINRLSIVREHSDDTVDWLRGQLIIDYPDDAEIMRVAMKGTKKDEIIKIVDKVVEVYLKEIVQSEKARKGVHEQQLRDTYGNQVIELEKEITALSTLEKIHNTSGSEEAQMKKKMAMDEMQMLLNERLRIANAMSENDMELMLTKTREQNPGANRPPDAVIEMELTKDPLILEFTKQLSSYNQAMKSIQGLSNSPNSNQVVKLRRAIQDLEESIEERKAELKPKLAEMLAATGSRSQYTLSPAELAEQQKYFASKLEEVNKKLNDKSQEVSKLETLSAQVSNQAEKVQGLRMITNELGSELHHIKIERLAKDRIEPLDKALLESGSGDAARKYMAMAFTSVLGFGIVVVAIAFLEFQARKINSVKEVNDGLGIRVVGELPNITGRAFRRIRGGKGPAVLKALMAERIDGTRTALIHSTAADPPRVVMVTSAQPHEGKTTTSTQLAASLARSGRRTLLIDADIRSPGVHRVFELPQDPGLCELLRGEAERDAVIHPTRTANLWLMPAGRCDLRSVQALSSSYLGTAIAALGVQFDFIIIDSGPVLKVADPLLVGQHVDAAIISVLRDVSKVPQVYEAVERLRSVGIQVFGSVVNGVKDDVARHGVELLMAEKPAEKPAEKAADKTEAAEV